MNLVLINPPPRRRAELYDRPNYPPLSLAWLAGSTLAAGIATVVVDAKFERLTLEQTVTRVVAAQPDAIGLTAMTHEITRAAEVAAELKKRLPAVPIILGGVHATFLPAATLAEFPGFDYIVAGEGELILPQLLAGLPDPPPLPGVARRGGPGGDPPPGVPPADLNALPPPAWQLWPAMPVYHLSTSRGCPYRCIFCAQAHGHAVRELSAERVADEFQTIIETYHPRRVYFVDETFGLNRARAARILELFRARNLGARCPWWAATRVDRADVPFLQAMKDAGCFLIQLGIESGSDAVLQRIGKGTTTAQAREAVANARRAGLKVEGLFILGHPHETRAEVAETLAFINELNPDHLALGVMVPYPGTELAAMIARGEGGYRLLASSWDAYNKQLGKALELTNLSRRELESAQLRGYLGLYLRHGRALDFLRFAAGNWRGAWAFLHNYLKGIEPPDWFPAGRSGDHRE